MKKYVLENLGKYLNKNKWIDDIDKATLFSKSGAKCAMNKSVYSEETKCLEPIGLFFKNVKIIELDMEIKNKTIIDIN